MADDTLYLLCAECGRSRFEGADLHCSYCGSPRLVLTRRAPAVLDYRDYRDPELDTWEGEGGHD